MSNKVYKQPIAIIAGARPNFMKIVPLVREFERRGVPFFVVNAGQHFSHELSSDFFDEFNLKVDYSLAPSREGVEKQRQDIFNGLEKIFLETKPCVVVVVGDVNATLTAARVAVALSLPVVHVEAGLRSYNAKMQEEYNRVEVDKMSTLLLAPSDDAYANLRKEGLDKKTVVVGNIMIDLLKMCEDEIIVFSQGEAKEVYGETKKFYFVTLHRAENVDDKKIFGELVSALEEIAKDAPLLLPLHPRTAKMAEQFGLMERLRACVTLLPPLSYHESIGYQKNAALVLTDSGGVQEETSVLGTPCLTLRTETERPITVSQGTNSVAGVTKDSIIAAYKKVDFTKRPAHIPLWDGKTALRIADEIEKMVA